MKCVSCGNEYAYLTCPICGKEIHHEACPACTQGKPISCQNCGQSLEVAKVDPNAPSPPLPPPPAGYPSPPPQQPVPPAPGWGAPPQPPHGGYYGTAGSTPPGQAYYPPPYNAPAGGYPPPGPPHPQSLPQTKVRLGGLLLFYFVMCCIGLAISAISLITSLVGLPFNFAPDTLLTVIIQAVCVVLPGIMILLCITRRNINFRKWFLFRAIVGFVEAAGIIVTAVMIGTLARPAFLSEILGSMPGDLMDEYLSLFGSGMDLEAFSDMVVSTTIIFLVIIAVIFILWYLLWLIYFKRSKRVAYTFNPSNNPQNIK